jgi:hypothetical protein
MIATPHLIFLHLHKSGGTFVNECLMQYCPGAQRIGYHIPRRFVPPPWRHLPILGLIRNPWSYYVSWYSFQSGRAQPNALFRILSEERQLDFAGTLRNMMQLGKDESLLDKVIGALPKVYLRGGLNLPGFALEPIRNSGLGFYSYLYHYLYQPAEGNLHIGKMERMRDDLLELLAQLDQPMSSQMRNYILTRAPANVSQHAAHPQYYSDELRSMVGRHDAELIDRHEYRFAD